MLLKGLVSFKIKIIYAFLILCLLVPSINVSAQEEVKIAYQPFAGEIINKPNGIPDPEAWAAFQVAQSLKIPKKANNAGYNCVQWAKKVTGVFGTWGDGGHYLSLNSNGEVGDVIVFKGTHVAVITARIGSTLTITEANYDYHGSIRTRNLNVASATIRGFHRF